jgi:CHAT domain-containing protein
VFLVSTRNFTVIPLEVKPKKLQAFVNRFSMAVKKENDISGEIELYGKILYNELFKPVEAELKGSRDIIINPDSILAKIPFEALITCEEESGRQVFLLEKYRMKYIQAASLLTHRRLVEQTNGEIKSFIGFGDPVYDYENDTKSKAGGETDTASSSKGNEMMELYRILYNRAGGSMKRIAGSGAEVKTIARLFHEKGKKTIVHLRENANETNLKAPGMKDFDIIHLACHGIMGGDFQSLLLARGSSGAREDGYFTLNEIMNCNYNANLIVLSSCLTASGKVESGESVTGLAAAFLYAGTPAVVASFWKVEDTAARELMVSFYTNLLEKHMDKSEALRQAKLELLKNKKYSSPFFWSAFVLYGE